MKQFFKILFFIFAVFVGTVAMANSSPILNSKANSFSILNSPFSINPADGRKLIVDAQYTTGDYEAYRSYSGNLVFDINDNLDYIKMPEGRIVHNNGTFTYEYHLTDHLGNVRVAFTLPLGEGQGGVVVQENSYYPFGGLVKDFTYSSNGYVENKLRYNAKELMGEFNLGWYDYGSRYYNPGLGIFMAVDPQAAKFPGIFAYGYCGNNPINNIDPDGEFFFSALLPGIGTFLDAACWGAVIGGAGYTANVAFSPDGFNNWDWGDFGKSVGFGAVSGMATAGVGGAFGAVGSNGIAGEALRALTHGVVNGTLSSTSGGNFASGFASGALSSIAGSAFLMYGGAFANSDLGAYAFSGLAGGIGAAATGGNFWQGAAIGLMNAGLNHLSTLNWSTASDKERIQAVLDAQKKALAKGESYFDLRKSIRNFSVAGGQHMAYMTIDGESIPVFLDIAVYDNMQINTSFQEIPANNGQPFAPNYTFKGIPKAGHWTSFEFTRYTNTYVARPLRMLSFQVPVQHTNIFSNHLSTK